jgi:hypothetical protein
LRENCIWDQRLPAKAIHADSNTLAGEQASDRDAGDVRRPGLARRRNLDVAQQIPIDFVAGVGLGGARTAMALATMSRAASPSRVKIATLL